MSPVASTKPRFAPWAFVPAVLLVLLGGLQLVLVKKAVQDPSFSIEDGYYSKAVSWDAHRAQDAENARLGWRVDVGWNFLPRGVVELILKPVDGSGASLTGARFTSEAFAVARSKAVVRSTFVEGPPGEYRARMRTLQAGLWELSFTGTRGSDRFTLVKRLDLPGEGAR